MVGLHLLCQLLRKSFKGGFIAHAGQGVLVGHQTDLDLVVLFRNGIFNLLRDLCFSA